jgi:hypothetical protein
MKKEKYVQEQDGAARGGGVCNFYAKKAVKKRSGVD